LKINSHPRFFERAIQLIEMLLIFNILYIKLEHGSLQLENEYLIQQQTILSKSATLNEMLHFKKELEKTERQREQLSDQLEVDLIISNSCFYISNFSH